MANTTTLQLRPVLTALTEISELVPRVLKTAWLQLVVIHVLRSITNELFTYAATMIQQRGREDIGLLASAIVLQFLVQMAWSALWVFVVIDAVKRSRGTPAMGALDMLERLNQLLIEGVRAISAIIYRLPLLIVPGLVEFIRLMFVPHVVLLDSDYQRGQVDALEKSRELTRGRWALLIFSAGLLMGIDTFVDYLLSQGSGDGWMWENPGTFAIATVFTLFTGLIYEVFLVALFIRLSMMLALRKEEG